MVYFLFCNINEPYSEFPTNADETAWMLSAKQSTFPNAATVLIWAEFLEQYIDERLWKNSWQIISTTNLLLLHYIPVNCMFRNSILFLRMEWCAILTCWETLHHLISWATNTRQIYLQLTLVIDEGITKKHDLFFSVLIIRMMNKHDFWNDPGGNFCWWPLHNLQIMAMLML